MNRITLIGALQAPPVYFCTENGQDLTRLQIATGNAGELTVHHCRAWGPAAIDLHRHLKPGDRLLIRGELKYRIRQHTGGTKHRVPVIELKQYTYLGRGAAAASGLQEVLLEG